MAPSARVARDGVKALLAAIGSVNVYDGDVPDNPPNDPDGKVHGYAVLWASPGQGDDRRLGGPYSARAWTFQVTVAGGDQTRALWTADKVIDALTGSKVTGSGTILTDGDPGPVMLDRDVTPFRYYVPLAFRTVLT